MSPTMKPVQARDNLAGVLRTAGLAAIVIAAVLCMLQGFADLAPLGRFGSLLAVTAALGTVGWACLRKLADPRTARLCLGLVMAMAPVQMSQVGGMIHAALDGGVASTLPRALLFSGMTFAQAGAAAAASVALLAPCLYLGFALVERQRARFLTTSYLIASAVLVLPGRSLPETLAIAAVGVAAARFASQSVARTAPTGSRAAAFVEALFLITPMIVAGRGTFYAAGNFAGAALTALFGYTAFVVLPRLVSNASGIAALQITGALAMACAWLVAATDALAYGALPLAVRAGIIGVPVVALLHELARRARYHQGFFRALALVASVVTIGSALVASGTVPGAAGTAALGLAFAALGVVRRDTRQLELGAGGVAAGLVCAGYHLVASSHLGSWVVVAVIGIGCFVLAAMRERAARKEATPATQDYAAR